MISIVSPAVSQVNDGEALALLVFRQVKDRSMGTSEQIKEESRGT
jgi:hypothetical protein